MMTPPDTFTHFFQDDANDDPWERVCLSLQFLRLPYGPYVLRNATCLVR